jgi:hypothetical protein
MKCSEQYGVATLDRTDCVSLASDARNMRQSHYMAREDNLQTNLLGRRCHAALNAVGMILRCSHLRLHYTAAPSIIEFQRTGYRVTA